MVIVVGGALGIRVQSASNSHFSHHNITHSATAMTQSLLSHRGMCSIASPVAGLMTDMSKDQKILNYEADLLRQLESYHGHLAHSLTGNQLLSFIQDLPIVVSHMESPNDPVSLEIISRTAKLLKAYPMNFEVHLNATFDAITELNSNISEVCELIEAVAQKVSKLNRSLTDAETWRAINSLRDFNSSQTETLALVAAIAKKIPVENTKIEFTPVDTVLISLRGLGGLNSDCEEVRVLLQAVNFRLQHKKGKVKFFSSFQGKHAGDMQRLR
jgi:hypothetical protein